MYSSDHTLFYGLPFVTLYPFLYVIHATLFNATALINAQPPLETQVNMQEVKPIAPGLKLAQCADLPPSESRSTFDLDFSGLEFKGYYQYFPPFNICYDIYFEVFSIRSPQIAHCEGPAPAFSYCQGWLESEFRGSIGAFVRNETELWVRVIGDLKEKSVSVESKVLDMLADIATAMGID